MTNEEKAQSITNSQKWILDLVDENNLSKEDRNQIRFKIYNALLEMVQWKEQQMIEKAVEWIQNNVAEDFCFDEDLRASIPEFIEDFKKAMKGE